MMEFDALDELQISNNTWLVGKISRYNDIPGGHRKMIPHFEIDLKHVWVRVGNAQTGEDIEVTQLLTKAQLAAFEELWTQKEQTIREVEDGNF
jgi:hypothetical protein